MGHIVLLGDSIFDNAAYVGNQPSVLDHLRQALPPGWQADLAAVDGATADDVREQVRGIEPSATHLFLSAGGNDAYNATGVLTEAVRTVAEALGLLAKVQARFRQDYQVVLGDLLALGKPLVICTIYDAIPGLGIAERTALSAFNDVIIRSAFEVSVPIIDLRLVCNVAEDYSDVSPIEPSAHGGAKIARVIAEVATKPDAARRSWAIWS